MIIRCEECETRFRLDEARIPDRGARVRCSRCDHSFVVRRPNSDTGDKEAAAALAKDAARAVAQTAAQPAARTASASAPATVSTTPPPSADSQTATAPETPSTAEDEDWEFGPSEADVPPPQRAAPPEPVAQPPAQDSAEAAPSAAAPSEDPVPSEPAHPREPLATSPPAPERQAAAEPGDPAAAESAQAAIGDSMSDLLTSEDGVDRAVAASRPAPDAAPSENTTAAASASASSAGEAAVHAGAAAAEVSSFDIDDPFGVSGADLSGTGTLESDDRDFEAAAAGVAADSGDANEDSFAAIGDPSSWNLLSDEEATPDPASFPSPAEPSPPPAAAPPRPADDPLFPPTDLFSTDAADPARRESAPTPPSLGGVDYLADFLAADDSSENTEPPSLIPRIARSASVAAWPLTGVLIAIAFWNLLSPRAPAPSSRFLALDNGFELHGLESRVVENVFGGPLLVVTGDLRNAGARRQALESALTITLLDVEGQRLDGAQALMAPTPAEGLLREQDPTLLRGQGDHDARRAAFDAFAPDEGRSFTAVFDGMPGGATGFSVELRRLPGPPAAPAFVGPTQGGVEVDSARQPEPVETATALPSAAPLSPE